MTRERLYIGTYTRKTESEGIHRASFDTESAELELENAIPADNPSFLAVNTSARMLYAVNEVRDFGGADSGAVTTFAIDARDDLHIEDQRSSEGALPCHLTLLGDRHLVVANYGGANVCVFTLTARGVAQAPSQVLRHEGHGPDTQRQREPHPHQAVAASEDLLLIPDLGLDRIVCYRLRGGRLVPNDPPWAQTAPGSGPRHCIVHSKRAYLINEIDNTIDAFELEPSSGALTHLQRISTLPRDYVGRSACADIHVDARGRFLYGSNRGHDSIVVCSIGADGLLEVRSHVPCGGSHPRNFSIDPSGKWLLVANRDSNNIVTFSLDPQSGLPSPHGEFHVPAPVCLLWG